MREAVCTEPQLARSRLPLVPYLVTGGAIEGPARRRRGPFLPARLLREPVEMILGVEFRVYQATGWEPFKVRPSCGEDDVLGFLAKADGAPTPASWGSRCAIE